MRDNFEPAALGPLDRDPDYDQAALILSPDGPWWLWPVALSFQVTGDFPFASRALTEVMFDTPPYAARALWHEMVTAGSLDETPYSPEWRAQGNPSEVIFGALRPSDPHSTTRTNRVRNPAAKFYRECTGCIPRCSAAGTGIHRKRSTSSGRRNSDKRHRWRASSS